MVIWRYINPVIIIIIINMLIDFSKSAFHWNTPEMLTHLFPIFYSSGPMVQGIAPSEASDRLQLFQARFDELWRKFVTYSGGEELFGLAVTDYPDIQRIKRELTLLQKLYQLYNAVIDNVNGYYDIPWVEVDIEKINQELLDFQNK